MATGHLNYVDLWDTQSAVDRITPIDISVRFHHFHAQPIDALPTPTAQERERERRRKKKLTIPVPDIRLDCDWKNDANCKGRSELFFPPKGEHPEMCRKRERQAAELCAACAVIDQCNEYALVNREVGFWAGANEMDRK